MRRLLAPVVLAASLSVLAAPKTADTKDAFEAGPLLAGLKAREIGPAVMGGRVSERNAFRQPSFFNLDLRLVKAIVLGKSQRLELVAELFNATGAGNKNFGSDGVSAFGTPQSPVVTAGQPLFAPSTARYGGPRQVQLGVAFRF